MESCQEGSLPLNWDPSRNVQFSGDSLNSNLKRKTSAALPVGEKYTYMHGSGMLGITFQRRVLLENKKKKENLQHMIVARLKSLSWPSLFCSRFACVYISTSAGTRATPVLTLGQMGQEVRLCLAARNETLPSDLGAHDGD